MFDLEKSIAEWRQQMLAAGIKTPATLAELEGHLREEFERQMKLGINERVAFDVAAKTIGRGVELKKEFKKLGEPLDVRIVKLLGIGCGTVAFVFSLWILPFLLFNQTGWMAKMMGVTAVAAIVLGWIYNYKFLPAVRSQSVRVFIGLLCCIGGVIGIQLFIRYFLPSLLVNPGAIRMRESGLMSVFLWAWTIMANLCGIGMGLEKAARKQEFIA